MKHIILSFAFLAILSTAQAQNSDLNNGRNDNRREAAPKENEFTNTEMAVHPQSIGFSEVPELPKAIWAIITDAQGEIVKQSRISPAYSKIDTHRMDRGMYFVSLVYKNKTKKAFVLQVEQ